MIKDREGKISVLFFFCDRKRACDRNILRQEGYGRKWIWFLKRPAQAENRE